MSRYDVPNCACWLVLEHVPRYAASVFSVHAVSNQSNAYQPEMSYISEVISFGARF